MGKILLDVLTPELECITEPYLKKIVKELLLECSDFNAVRPSSSSGKYHPKHDLGFGGNVRHTKTVCMFLSRFMTADPSFKGDSTKAQIVFAAGILHDLRKYDDADPTHSNPHHSVLMADDIRKKAQFVSSRKDRSSILSLADIVERHMSVWGEWKLKDGRLVSAGKPSTTEDWLLVYADLAASAKWVHVDFDQNNGCQEFA